jgi:hypothetical protein
MKYLAKWSAAVAALVAAAACAGSGGAGDQGTGTSDGGASSGSDATLVDANGATPGDGGTGLPGDAGTSGSTDAADGAVCAPGEKVCLDHATASACTGGAWVTTACPAGSGCFQGACTPNACSDECTLGATSDAGTCTLVDITTGQPVAPNPAGDLHDRARAYDEFLRATSLTYGGIGDARYGDTTYTTITSMNDIADSAIWTGTWLASESARLLATGDPDARANLRAIIDTLHLWFNVEGDPGVLSRFVTPAGQRPAYALSDIECEASDTHCDVPYGDGGAYDLLGHISRDQYQGVLLGYALAYQALTSADEDERAKIREDVVTFVTELMKDRSVQVSLTINGIPLTSTITMRFIVLISREMTNGGVQIALDTSDLSSATMTGFQEFTPDLADIVKQFPGLSGTPSIPRASSAIMLASFFKVAMLVTDGVPAYAAQRSAIQSYYLSHGLPGGDIHDWLGVAETFSDTSSCGSSYYGNNITMEPLYNLASLETDPGLLATIRGNVIEQHVWPTFVDTKNVFFSFITAGVDPTVDLDGSVVATGAAQIAQFPPPTRIDVAVDLLDSGKYPTLQSGCTNQVVHTTAVDVGDRVPDEFIWQRDPWELVGGGDLQQTYPGVDYLVAYWLGRKHGFLTDPNPQDCLVWR